MSVVVTSPTAGIVLLLGALVALGTWPAMMDVCTLYKRNSTHIYLDYATGDLLLATLLALTLGSLGPASPENPSFFVQVADIDRNWPSVLSALAGGALLMFGNLTLQIALTMGTSLGVILPIQGALCVIISTTINYALNPDANDPTLLFTGMFFFLLAILASSCAEVGYKGFLANYELEHPKGIAVRRAERKTKAGAEASKAQDERFPDGGEPQASAEASEEGRAESSNGEVEGELVDEAATIRAKQQSSAVVRGLVVASCGGVAFGFFSPSFNIGVNDQFKWLPEGTVHLTGWTANFYFGVSFWFWAHVVGFARIGGSPSAALKAYVQDHDKRALAVATGMVCCLGNTMQFLGGMAAGFATCDMVQAFPLVGILWGMLLFGEFRKAPLSVKALLVGVYIVYIIAVALLALSVKA